MEGGGRQSGEGTGAYCLGGDALLSDPDGKSTIGGEDFATVILDEIDNPTHHRQRFTVVH